MHNTETSASRVNVSINEYMADSIASMKGTAFDLKGNHHRFGTRPIDTKRYLSGLLEEALFAAEEYADEHGYLPWQPRFVIQVAANGKPSSPRRWAKIAEDEAIKKVLLAAETQIEKAV